VKHSFFQILGLHVCETEERQECMKEIKDEQQHKENERKIAAQESVNKYILGRALTYRTRILQEIILNSTSIK